MAEPLKSRSDTVITAVFNKIYEYFTSRYYKPKIHKLSSESSILLKNSMRAN